MPEPARHGQRSKLALIHWLAAGAAPGGHYRQRLPRALVNDVEQLQDPPVRGLVELEVQRPDMVRPLSPQPHGGHRRVPEALTLASFHRDAQPNPTEHGHNLATRSPHAVVTGWSAEGTRRTRLGVTLQSAGAPGDAA